MDVTGINSYYDTLQSNASSSAAAGSAQNALRGLSKDSSDEELRAAVESFESYMVEQLIKQMRETTKLLNEDDDSDAVMNQYTDFYMDTTIQEIASQMVSDYGSTLTDELVEQMKRNYGI